MNTKDEQHVTNILETLIADEAAKNMQKSMDYDLLCEIMVPFGYTVVKIEYGSKRKWFEVMEWLANNHIGEYQEHNGKWLFKHEQDAIMFKLRWYD